LRQYSVKLKLGFAGLQTAGGAGHADLLVAATDSMAAHYSKLSADEYHALNQSNISSRGRALLRISLLEKG
jgi:hypothetical protein